MLFDSCSQFFCMNIKFNYFQFSLKAVCSLLCIDSKVNEILSLTERKLFLDYVLLFVKLTSSWQVKAKPR